MNFTFSSLFSDTSPTNICICVDKKEGKNKTALKIVRRNAFIYLLYQHWRISLQEGFVVKQSQIKLWSLLQYA